MSEVDWIAVDWGSSNLRIWGMKGDTIVHEKNSDEGMRTLQADQFEPVLLKHVESWLSKKTRVLACGMVGSRQGWFEAPYVATPCSALPRMVNVPTLDPRLDVRIVSGIKQEHPADVMRGEETQVAGFMRETPDFEGVICLPGTHSKWVEMETGKIKRFQTLMTGECFALLSQKSLLRFSMGQWDEQTFLDAVQSTIEHPETALAGLFSIRARDLLYADQAGEAALSGVLIGSELAGTKSLWHDRKVMIIGAGDLADAYLSALQSQGAQAVRCKGSAMTLKGLQNIYEEWI